jgi:phosphoglycerol transferase
MQLPYSPYPEIPDLLGSYAQFRNNLHAPSLHWSHGAMRARPEGNWLAEVNTLPADAFVDVMQAVGFSALVLDQRALNPKMSEIQQRFSERTQATRFSAPDNSQTAVVSATLLRPTARAIIQDSDWHATEGDAERRWTWSLDRPTFALSPADPGTGDCSFSLSLASIRPMKVKVVDPQGEVLGEAALNPDAVAVLQLKIPAHTRRVVLENEVPASPAGNGDPRPLAIRWDRAANQQPLCRYVASMPR